MTLSEMRRILGQGDIQLTKSLGQNFLHDGNQIRRMLAAAELGPQDKVLEIGPGLGPLTEMLLEQVGHVLAIEKDRRLVEVLRQRFPATPNLTLLHDDALDYLARKRHDWTDWKMVSNLPYSVASPLLVELAQSHGPPQLMVNTLQYEVAQRLMAQPGDDHYGVLALLVQVDFEPRGLFKIPSGCFFPEPDVESACVTLARRTTPVVTPSSRRAFEKIVRRGFSQRRKMLLKLLRADWPRDRLARAFDLLQFSPLTRAEALSLHDFARLAAWLSTPEPVVEA